MAKSIGVVACDNGGSSTVLVTKDKKEIISSCKGVYGNRTFAPTLAKNDFIVELKGQKFIVGEIAKYNCKYPLQMQGDTKCHQFFDLSLLSAIHQYGYDENYVVVSVPISQHNTEKELLPRRLEGKHTLVVNGIERTFTINKLLVTPESAVAFWNKQPQNVCHWLDIGSRTIGYATTHNINGICNFIDDKSGTFKMGIEALGSDFNCEALADYICGRLMATWDKANPLYIFGGGAYYPDLVQKIKSYFPKAVVMSDPVTCNSLGMYLLGRTVFKMA